MDEKTFEYIYYIYLMPKKRLHFINGIKIIEFSNTNVYIIENMIDESLCNSIIESINSSQLVNVPTTNTQNVECYRVTKLNTNGLDEILHDKLIDIIKIIKILKPMIHINKYSPYDLRKVYGKTNLHQDGVHNDSINKQGIRSITIVAGLNDDYTGGLYSFPQQQLEFKLKKGSVLFFPPFWTHTHCVSSIDKGNFRYIFSTWGLE